MGGSINSILASSQNLFKATTNLILFATISKTFSIFHNLKCKFTYNIDKEETYKPCNPVQFSFINIYIL